MSDPLKSIAILLLLVLVGMSPAAGWAQSSASPALPQPGVPLSVGRKPPPAPAPQAPGRPAAAQPPATARPAQRPAVAPVAPAAASAPASAARLPVGGAPQKVVAPRAAAPTVTAATGGGNLIDVQAEDLSYDAERRLVIARGGVKVTRGTDSVAADYAEVDTAQEQVYARGNIFIRYMGGTWQGQEATYNFKTGAGNFGAFHAYSAPYHVTAEGSTRESPRLMKLEQVMFTTCEPERPEYSLRAKSASIEDNNIVRAKHVRFHFGPVPFFWVPYMRANLEELAKFEFTPGWSSAMGPFLLTTYNQPINDIFKTRTHVDIRQKRGLGVGEDLVWKDPVAGDYQGEAGVYYANDRKPWKDAEERTIREELIDNDRCWLKLSDRHNLTDRDYLITKLNYVSDPWLLSDFFDDEYQKNVQPENRVTLTHRGDHYSAGVGLNTRLNDFYGNVNRLPEVFLNFNRQKILDTPFYYEGENTFSYLDRVFPDGAPEEHYDAFRLDTAHMVYWPTRHFGFLSVIPRAGYRGTYYSKTRHISTVTNVIAITNDLGEVIGTTNEVETLLRDGSAVWRSLPELGVESSFQAFGNLYEGPTGIEEDEDLRHIVEPYANYTYRPEPNVLPEELWQFDAVDRLSLRNDLKLGVRNYLQTRRARSVHDLLFADVFTTLLFEPDDDEQTLGDIGFKAEVRPYSWLSLDVDGTYDTQDGNFRVFSTQAEVKNRDLFIFGLDYRYARDARDKLAGDLVIFPEARWAGRLYARMDLDESELEEHSYYLIHRTRCLGIGLGLRVRPDDGPDGEDNYTVWFRIWPLAFPQFGSSLGG